MNIREQKVVKSAHRFDLHLDFTFYLARPSAKVKRG